jgi:hypothetical protein
MGVGGCVWGGEREDPEPGFGQAGGETEMEDDAENRRCPQAEPLPMGGLGRLMDISLVRHD